MKKKAARSFPGLSVRGTRTIAAGTALVAAGLALLVFCDAGGKNWAATLSPFLTLAGYAAVFFGIFQDDPADHQGI